MRVIKKYVLSLKCPCIIIFLNGEKNLFFTIVFQCCDMIYKKYLLIILIFIGSHSFKTIIHNYKKEFSKLNDI